MTQVPPGPTRTGRQRWRRRVPTAPACCLVGAIRRSSKCRKSDTRRGYNPIDNVTQANFAKSWALRKVICESQSAIEEG